MPGTDRSLAKLTTKQLADRFHELGEELNTVQPETPPGGWKNAPSRFHEIVALRTAINDELKRRPSTSPRKRKER